jgi:hypothetical protein
VRDCHPYHSRYLIAEFAGLKPASLTGSEEPDYNHLGRLVSQDSGDRKCLDVAAGWLERCSRHHKHCAQQRDVELPARLVQIPLDDNHLLKLRVTEGQTGRYMALSHCWGNGIAFKTTKATFNDKQDGFKLDQIPRNLRDAVHIARSLGFEYLWVDALCIIQDSPGDWAGESSKMARIYGNASLTLCADLAPHSEFGILRPRNTIRSHLFGSHGELCLQTRGEGWAAMPQMPLTRRGWTFQERVLSARILHFLGDQIAWECKTTLYLEEHHAAEIEPPVHFSIQGFVREVLHQPSNSRRDGSADIAEAIEEKMSLTTRISHWNSFVSELNVRNFTKLSDKFPSLSGLASALEVPGMGKYLAGVWEYDVFQSMTWFPRWPQTLTKEYRAPSWSWAAAIHQLIWYIREWKSDPEPVERDDLNQWKSADMSAWNMWNSRFKPQLLSHHIVHASADLKGEVKEGSHIIFQGFCRDIHIMEEPNSLYDAYEFLFGRRLGRKVHMDIRKGHLDSISFFAEDLENPGVNIDMAHLETYVCVQIARERRKEFPKILALILKRIEGSENTFRRVGLLAFDDISKNVESLEWKAQALKLI